MKHPSCSPASGYALLTVLVFAGASTVILMGALSWASQNARYNNRLNEHTATTLAAEAATEKILCRMSSDFQNGGEAAVFRNLAAYRSTIPGPLDGLVFTNYQFSNPDGTSNSTFTGRFARSRFAPLQSQYQGLSGYAATYTVIANAHNTTGGDGLSVGVAQEVQLASIPIFQFAIFYAMDLEINPGPLMRVTGRVHSNGSLYAQPQNNLTFLADVTSSGNIILNKKPGDPSTRSPGSVNFQGAHDSGVTSMNLPIGTNNNPDAVHCILEVPPAGEVASSPMGKERFYNKADMIILVSNNTVTALSGLPVDNFGTAIPPAEVSTFLATNVLFYDKREGKNIKTTQLDVGKLKQWSQTNQSLQPVLGRDVSSIYVADFRTQTSSEPGVRLINAQNLPSGGLTVATPDPLYVMGNFNASGTALGSSDTSSTKPASLLGDSINILSTRWSDADSGSAMTSRVAGDTTVNAAFLGGITTTTNGNYSGGVENFPRFLEDWSGKTFTYNGSMVVMFDSRIAKNPWGSSGVYLPPNRNWAFDNNFKDPRKLPPCTPQILSLIRSRWATVKPGQTLF